MGASYSLSVKAVGADVFENRAGEKLRGVSLRGGAWVGLLARLATKLFSNLLSNLRCADLHIEPGKQVE